MLFNSYKFILLFLPIALIVYFTLNKYKLTKLSKIWLTLSSFFFYAYWNPIYIFLLSTSIIVNFITGLFILKTKNLINKKWILISGLVFNLGLLGYYKYTDFFISNINTISGSDISLLQIILPLGISFFTFTQIAYLVDAYKGKAKEPSFLNYCLFVTYFPHLIAGPIIHHSEMMPQFDSKENKEFNDKNFSEGIFLFVVGLVKKVIIADAFAKWAVVGYGATGDLKLIEAWVTSLSYTFQLYFDFSGYTDMALGLSNMFNIKLPINFNSPYKAQNIQDFWRRWHMTLSRFLRDYIYIPLGGNRKGSYITCQNLMITFIVGGLWHGAGWTFILWGGLHGFALVIHRLWQTLNIKMHKFLAWFITFNFVNVCWVFFRAETMTDATNVLKAMIGLNGFVLPKYMSYTTHKIIFIRLELIILYLIAALIATAILKNSNEITEKFKPSPILSIIFSVLTIWVLFKLNRASEFLYFNF